MISFFKYILSNYSLLTLCTISLALLQVRFAYTGDDKFIFLVWNLFLAIIPYLIGKWLRFRESENPYIISSLLLIWLLFLPNAIYLITDFIHLKISDLIITTLDFLILGSFSCAGTFMAFESMKDSYIMLNKHLFNISKNKYYCIITFLSAMGVYLGRVLRWNSWDILRDPSGLVMDSIHLFIHPLREINAWIFIGAFFTFTLISLRLYNHFFYEK